jgi:hypothetical protein
MLRRAPVTTTAVVMMLALGIGSSTIVFSVVDPAFIRPVPYDDPDSLVLLNEQSPLASLSPVAYEDYLDWRRESTAFSALAAQNRETFNLTGMGDPQQVRRTPRIVRSASASTATGTASSRRRAC